MNWIRGGQGTGMEENSNGGPYGYKRGGVGEEGSQNFPPHSSSLES